MRKPEVGDWVKYQGCSGADYVGIVYGIYPDTVVCEVKCGESRLLIHPRSILEVRPPTKEGA